MSKQPIKEDFAPREEQAERSARRKGLPVSSVADAEDNYDPNELEQNAQAENGDPAEYGDDDIDTTDADETGTDTELEDDEETE